MPQNPISGVEENVPAPLMGRKSTAKLTATYEYDFRRQGGAIGDFILRGPTLPNNAIITDCWIDVITAPATDGQGTAAIALGFVSATDIQTSANYNGAPYSTEGLADLAGPEPGTESGYIKLTSAVGLLMTIVTGGLTAGRFFVSVDYVVTD